MLYFKVHYFKTNINKSNVNMILQYFDFNKIIICDFDKFINK